MIPKKINIGGQDVFRSEVIGKTLYRPDGKWPGDITDFDDRFEEVVLNDSPAFVPYAELRRCSLDKPVDF